jgi:hypothetical protein
MPVYGLDSWGIVLRLPARDRPSLEPSQSPMGIAGSFTKNKTTGAWNRMREVPFPLLTRLRDVRTENFKFALYFRWARLSFTTELM